MRLRLEPLTSAGGPERETPFLERVRPCFMGPVWDGFPIEPWLVMWSALPRVTVSLRECADCHLELPVVDLRVRVAFLPDLPEEAPYVPSFESSSSSSSSAAASSSSSSSSKEVGTP